MPDLVTHLLRLPESVEFQGIEFNLTVFKNATDELRLCYEISHVDAGSPHKDKIDLFGCWDNPLLGDEIHSCGFLYLVEGIDDDKGLFEAITLCRVFLAAKHLI